MIYVETNPVACRTEKVAILLEFVEEAQRSSCVIVGVIMLMARVRLNLVESSES